MDKKKRILLIATTPFISDGLTKIELDVLSYNREEADFTIASRFGFDTPIGKRLQEDPAYHCVCLPSKKHVISYQKAIGKLVASDSFDAVYIHGNSSMMLFEARPAKKAGASKVVTHCHNTKSNLPLLDKLIKKSFNKYVDVKIACSQYVADFAYDGKRVELILNGPELSKFEFDPLKRNTLREELGIGPDTLVVGHVGRLIAQKNHRKLLEIFAELHRKKEDSKLLLIGEGELLDQIQTRIRELNLSDAVIMVGHTDTVADFYHVMDLMVMPSLHEGLCLVAMEAQANGMPVFVADTFSPETLATGAAHQIALEKPAGEWADAILAAQPARGNYSGELIQKGMTWDAMMKRIRNCLFLQ